MNFLISYPRSGNTFFRYCVEYLARRPTLPCFTDDTVSPIFSINNSGITIEDYTPIIAKEHFWKNFEFRLTKDSRVVLMIRDFNKCIVSHLQRGGFDYRLEVVFDQAFHYMSLIKRFHEYEGKKLVLYYEDFVNDPGSVLKRFFELLSIEDIDLGLFLNNYDYHVNKSKSLYSPGMINRRKIDADVQQTLCNYIKSLDEKIFNKFLLRYSI